MGSTQSSWRGCQAGKEQLPVGFGSPGLVEGIWEEQSFPWDNFCVGSEPPQGSAPPGLQCSSGFAELGFWGIKWHLEVVNTHKNLGF